MGVQIWAIEKLIFYARNPRKNEAAVDRMVASLPVRFAQIDGERLREVWDAAA